MNREELKQKIEQIQIQIDKIDFDDEEYAEQLFKRKKKLEFKLHKLECEELGGKHELH